MKHDREKVREALQRLLANGPLATFCLPGSPDHVTLRRCLVGAKFLTRNKAGSAYEATMGRVGAVLADAAREVEPVDNLEEIRRDRESRKRDRGRQEARS